MDKSAKSFYEKYLGKSIDYDKGYGTQCVDGARVWMDYFIGESIPCSYGWAYGYWTAKKDKNWFLNHGCTLVTNVNDLQDGDLMIWGKGSSCAKSHVSMYYQGKSFGENQHDDKYGAGFSLKSLKLDILGAYRSNNCVNETTKFDINVGGTSTDTTSDTFKGTFTADTALNIRSECTTNSTVLACMKKGEECTCTGQAKLIPNDGGRAWMKVSYKGITGFAYSRYLTKKKTSSSTSSTIKVGSVIQIKNGSKNYYGVAFGSATYTNKYTVSAVNGDKVTFLSRSGADNYVNKANCKYVSQFKAGTKFKIVKCNGTSKFGSATFTNTYTVNSISGSTVTFLSKSGAINTINVKYCYQV